MTKISDNDLSNKKVIRFISTSKIKTVFIKQYIDNNISKIKILIKPKRYKLV